jgi:hypothetical protein
MKNFNDQRLNQIFSDLQRDRFHNGRKVNLIDNNRKLVATENAINFQGDHLKKVIKYNPTFFENHFSKCSDNSIRFVLLHEESHLTKGKNYLFLFAIPIIFITLITLYLCYSPITLALVYNSEFSFNFPNRVLGILFFIIALPIAISITWRFLWDSMFDEEINCDIAAAEGISFFFEEKDPANCAQESLMQESTEQEKKDLRLLKIIMKILGFYPDYHPTNCERIEIIKEKYPAK